MYNILTDSLALITTFSIDESTEKLNMDNVEKSKWSNLFEQYFKELKHFLI